MNKLQTKLFARAILSSIDSRLYSLAEDFSEYLEPLADKITASEASGILEDICAVVYDPDMNSDCAIRQIKKILNDFGLDFSK